jgi:hypothetical protein
VVKLKNYSLRDEILLLNDLRSYLNDIEVDIVYVDHIEKTKNNKLRFVVSEMKHQKGKRKRPGQVGGRPENGEEDKNKKRRNEPFSDGQECTPPLF